MRLSPPPGFRGVFRADDTARAVYSEAAGIARIVPRAVAVPADATDVAALARWSHDTVTALVPRGSGSGMAGGAIGDGVIVDLSRLGDLDAPDTAQRCIRAGAGVLRGALQRRALRAALRFPVDPSSGEFCTVGGMAATNAAGAHSLLHGAMRPWVLALECVFADGSRGTVRRGAALPDVPAVQRFVRDVHPAMVQRAGAAPAVLKNSSGYATDVYRQTHELVDLMVGSEGTLALFTAVEVALIPAAGGSASLFVSFRSLERAVEAAVAAREGGAAACELLDRTFIGMAARAGNPLPGPADADAALLVDIEAGEPAGAAARARELEALFRGLQASEVIVAVGAEREAELWEFRHAASPAIATLDPSLRSMQFIEDAAVPPVALARYVRGVREILARHDTPGVIFGHAGDAHVHVNPLVNVSRPDWRARIAAILDEVTALVASLGGTLAGEHGDGRLRTPLLERTWPPGQRAEFAAIKRAFDPAGTLNPGVKVPLPGQQPFDAIKYDPRLVAHPAGAGAALGTVERERGYARHRLDLLD